jgi:hypothetical protein
MSNRVQPDNSGSSGNNNDSGNAAAGETIDEGLLALLALLWEAAQTTPLRPWSLAKLSKRAGVQMSSLLRQLNVLTAAGLVQITDRDVATSITATIACAELTETGRDLCAVIFDVNRTR